MATRDAAVKLVSGLPGQRRPVIVDGFTMGAAGDRCVDWVLTHFHSDHTVGLSSSFARGLIYCTPVTAQLIQRELGVSASCIYVLNLGETHANLRNIGLSVTFVDAHHCPGAAVVFFETLREHELHVHTGDFRADAEFLAGVRGYMAARAYKNIATLWLDTTYFGEKWRLPPVADVLACVVTAVQAVRDAARLAGKRVLYVVGSYTVGKERVAQVVSEALGEKVSAEQGKRVLLSICGYGSLLADPQSDTCVRVCGFDKVQSPLALRDAFQHCVGDGKQWDEVVGFKCSGWTLRKKDAPPAATAAARAKRAWLPPPPAAAKCGAATLFSVPYSEHSSHDELRAFVAATRPAVIIPTVGSEDTRRQARQTLLKPVQSSLRPWVSSKRRKTESERDVLVIVDDEPVIDLTASPPRPS